ncbi:MAG: peptide ABC transporter substrate-binding protein [Enterococcus sp.]
MKNKKILRKIVLHSVVALSVASFILPTTAQADKTQSINVSTSGEIATLDSVDSVDTNSSDTIGQTTEGLYRLDKKGKPELGIAKEEPTVSEDGKTYTFKLRESKWSNGDKLTANDFVYAFQKTLDPKEASGSADQLDIFKNAQAIREGKADKVSLGVKALDDETLEIQLENPISYLPQILVGTHFVPQPSEYAQKLGADFGNQADSYVGNGPFTIKGWDGTNESWELVKNDNYWDAENVKLDTINVQVIKEVATGVKLFEDGQLDYTPVSDVFAAQKADDPEEHSVDKALVGYVSANEKREATGNVHLRKALLRAINKEAFTSNVLADGSQPLDGYVPTEIGENPESSADFRSDSGKLNPYNLKKAKKEWKKAQKELGQKELTLELLSADTDVAKKTVEYLQGQLEENLPGLTIEVKSVPLNNRLDLQAAGDFDLVFGTWTGDYADPYDFLKNYASTSGLNTAGYASDSYDDKLAVAQGEYANDPEKRWATLLDAEEQLVKKDAAVLPIYQGAATYLKSDQVKGIKVLNIGRTVSYRLAHLVKK